MAQVKGTAKHGGLAQMALDSASIGITQDAVMRNVTRDLEDAAEQERLGLEVTALSLEHTKDAYDEAHGTGGEEKLNSDLEDDFDDDPALRALEARRMAQLKKKHEKRMVNEAKGHGELREITEDEFLPECCKSDRVVVHFFHADFERCKIMDKHLRLLALKYNSCKFVKIDAEKSPFFVSKLQIRTLPTVLIFHDGVNKDRITGFEELGGEDEFPTRTLEVRLHTAGAIYLKPQKKSAQKSALGYAHRCLSFGDGNYNYE